jgi:DNA-binding LacI/PurR family transcriptional regulator
MHQPISELAEIGTRSLIDWIRTGRPPRTPERLRYELVVRASTARAAAGATVAPR